MLWLVIRETMEAVVPLVVVPTGGAPALYILFLGTTLCAWGLLSLLVSGLLWLTARRTGQRAGQIIAMVWAQELLLSPLTWLVRDVNVYSANSWFSAPRV